MKTKPILLLLLSTLLFTNCKATFDIFGPPHDNNYYIANTQHISTFKEKGDFNGSFLLYHQQSLTFNPGLELHGAYALTNNIGIMAGYDILGVFPKYQNKDWQRGHQFNAAIGYFSYSDQKNRGYEIFGGVRHSNQQHSYYDKDRIFSPGRGLVGEATLSYFKYYVQPAVIWYLCDDVCELALSANLSYLNFYDITPKNLLSDEALRVLNKLDGKRKHNVLIEPAVTFNFNYKSFKFNFQWVYTGVLYPMAERESFSPIISSVGLTYTIRGSKKSKQSIQ